MLTNCLKCNKDTENADSKFLKNKNGRPILLSKCSVCSTEKSRFMKEQEAKVLFSSFGLKTSLSKVLLLGDILL